MIRAGVISSTVANRVAVVTAEMSPYPVVVTVTDA